MLLERNDPPPAEDDYRLQLQPLPGMPLRPKWRSGAPQESSEKLSLREDILATLRRLEPHAAALGSQFALDELHREVAYEGNHSTFLRRQFAEEGGAQGMVDAAVRVFRQ